MSRRLVKWGNQNPSLLVLAMTGIVVSIGVGVEAHQSRTDAHEARDRSAEIASTAIETCKKVVLAVTTQQDADFLVVLKALQQNAIDAGRPVPPWVRQVMLIINTRQPPTGVCVPKENP